jgi:hypothetical protein
MASLDGCLMRGDLLDSGSIWILGESRPAYPAVAAL